MKKILISLLFFTFAFQNLYALVKVDITRGNLDPLPIAISPLHVDPNSEELSLFETKKLGQEVSKIIENNFRSTGLF